MFIGKENKPDLDGKIQYFSVQRTGDQLVLKKIFSFEVDLHLEGLFGEYLVILSFVNKSFYFFTNQAANDRSKYHFFPYFTNKLY